MATSLTSNAWNALKRVLGLSAAQELNDKLNAIGADETAVFSTVSSDEGQADFTLTSNGTDTSLTVQGGATDTAQTVVLTASSSAAGFTVYGDSNTYMTVSADATSGTLLMAGATGQWAFNVAPNQADALSFGDGLGNDLLVLKTTTGALEVTPVAGLGAAGGFTFSPRLCHTGGVPAQISTEGTDLAVVVTELYVAEVFVPANATITGVAVLWGSATNGNAKVMLFDSTGTRVAISASTDVSSFTNDSYGTNIAFSATYKAKGPATYYVGVICDDNTNKVNTHILGAFGAGKITGLVYATESGYASITVPTTFTTGLGPIASLY